MERSQRRLRPLPLLAILAALLAASAVQVGPSAAAGPDHGCVLEQVEHLGTACRTPDGMWEVVLEDGTRLPTHGPDPYLDPEQDAFASFFAPRDPTCVTGGKHYIHVLYGYPGSSRYEQVAPQLRDHIRAMNGLLAEEAMDSGGVTADYRVLCDEEGQIVVSPFEGPRTGGAYTSEYDDIVSAARRAGHQKGAVDYLIFYDATSSVCGVANLYKDSRLATNNRNIIETGYGIAYRDCWSGRTPMHENGHNQGAVQDLAPDWDLSGHCLEGRDVLCYPTSEILVLCGDRIHFDCDNDTYFDAAPEAGEWLASNWNIGWRENPFLHFDRDAQPPPAPAPPPATAPPPPPPGSPPPPPPPPPPPSGTPTSTPTATPSATPSASPTPGPVADVAPVAPQPAQEAPALAAAAAVLAVAFAAWRRRA